MRVLDVFSFQDGRTVLVVEGRSDHLLSMPTAAALIVGERIVARLTIDAERLPETARTFRSFETRDPVDVTTIRSEHCFLRLDP